jgi:hypothetical protein
LSLLASASAVVVLLSVLFQHGLPFHVSLT